MANYIKGKGILVGTYNDKDLSLGVDKVATRRMQALTGYNYTNTKLIKRNGHIIGLSVYVCSKEDFKI